MLRLVTFVSQGQGYTWNTQLFLPDSGRDEYEGMEMGIERVPVHEIRLEDEDLAMEL
jgi:hypothetical protein